MDIAPTPSVATLVGWVVLDGILSRRFSLVIPDNFVSTFRHLKEKNVQQVIFSAALHKFGNESVRFLSSTSQGDLSTFFEYLDYLCDKRRPEVFAFLVQQIGQAGIPSSEVLVVTFSETESYLAVRSGFRMAKVRQANQPPVGPSVTLINDVSEIRLADEYVDLPPLLITFTTQIN